MILFDYGQTLVNERKFDGVKGTFEKKAEHKRRSVCDERKISEESTRNYE